MKRRAHFTTIVIGVQLDNGDQGVYLPGEEADLSHDEFQQLRNAWFFEVQAVGVLTETEGAIVRCCDCKGLWRRSPQLRQLQVCADCAMSDSSRAAAHNRHLRLS